MKPKTMKTLLLSLAAGAVVALAANVVRVLWHARKAKKSWPDHLR